MISALKTPARIIVPKDNATMNEEKLRQIAEHDVRDLIDRLPAALRKKVAAVAVILEARPDKARMAEGIESDTLGLFMGPSLPDGAEGALLPPQIILFLANIREEAQDSGRSFRAELQRTFLHELGHYLGLEEDDLVLRDVD